MKQKKLIESTRLNCRELGEVFSVTHQLVRTWKIDLNKIPSDMAKEMDKIAKYVNKVKDKYNG